MQRFEEDDDALVGVLAGAEGTFSAGADLQAMDLEDRAAGCLGLTRMRVGNPLSRPSRAIASRAGWRWPSGVISAWLPSRQPSAASSAGTASRSWTGAQRLPRIVGLGRALEMILTGEAVDVGTARDWWLANRVVPEGGARAAAVELGALIAEFPQTTVRTDRQAVYEGLGATLERGLAIENSPGSRASGTAREGAERFAGGEGRGGAGVPDREWLSGP